MNSPSYDFCKIDDLLERGFQSCLQHTLHLQETVEGSLHSAAAFRSLSKTDIVLELGKLCTELYRIIGRTLFQLIPMFHAEEMGQQERVNFYFWPGYHSYLANRRIFIHEPVDQEDWNFGVGICGNPEASDPEYYKDSSQARWYQYLVGPRNPSYIIPGDVHRWLLMQEPRSGDELQRFLTVTTADLPSDPSLLSLHAHLGSTESWGRLFSQTVNEMGITKDRSWIFPDSEPGVYDGHIAHREASSKMTSLWLHAVFLNHAPSWLDSFVQFLAEDEVTVSAAESLKRGLLDRVACDWGDADQHRPQLNSWTYLSLYPWPAPGLPPNFDLLSRAAGRPKWTLASQTLGSAEILASVVLGASYLAVVRRWIATIYGMIRSAEISILLHNYRVEVESAAMLAGPYFAQELKELVDGGLSRVLQEARDTTNKAIGNRLFVLRSARALGTLAYNVITAVLSRDEAALGREKDDFLTGLSQLRDKDALLTGLQQVANDIYYCVRREEGARIIFPSIATGKPSPQLNQIQFRSCFLVQLAMIRNYCESAGAISEANWSSDLSDSSLTIELAGSTIAQRNPASMSFARLDVFLDTLGIGKADVRWDMDQRLCIYTVTIELPARHSADPVV